MKIFKKIFTICFLLFYLLIPLKDVLGVTYDFLLSTDTTVNYTTGNDFVEVITQYTREVNNKSYYFATEGEQTFHIPDSSAKENEEIEEEREFKLNSLRVTSDGRTSIDYTVQKDDLGKGIYIKVPNYKRTTYGSKYQVYIKYFTHDYVKNTYGWVVLEYPGLHKDTKFEQVNDEGNTRTKIDYNLDIVVDGEIYELVKVFPEKYSVKSEKEKNIYSFEGKERISNAVYLEFGTKQIYRFEVNFDASKTDTLVPEKYSSVIDALSTNIYELSLPREFDENNQRVLIENIDPKPTRITTDTEGNVIARFEVPANQDSNIYISGYILVEQQPYTSRREIPDISFEQYKTLVSQDSNLSKYLTSTTYWQSNDPYIQQKSQSLLENTTTFMDVVESNYKYLNDLLDYDTQKAQDPDSTRIGALAALQGGPAVCMEYADSMIALLRAQGIPSRTAFGYTSLSTDTSVKIGHQWVQVWVPEYGWLSVDPSYESMNMMIGQSVQYALWDTFSGENLSNIRLFSADSIRLDGSEYKVQVYAVDESEILGKEDLLPYSEITFENSEEDIKDTVNLIMKTTVIGKALIVVMPILALLLVLILLLSLTKILFKRVRTRKAHPDLQP